MVVGKIATGWAGHSDKVIGGCCGGSGGMWGPPAGRQEPGEAVDCICLRWNVCS